MRHGPRRRWPPCAPGLPLPLCSPSLALSHPACTVDFNVQVLTSNTWPFSVQFSLNLPSSLMHCIDRFTTFFNVRGAAARQPAGAAGKGRCPSCPCPRRLTPLSASSQRSASTRAASCSGSTSTAKASSRRSTPRRRTFSRCAWLPPSPGLRVTRGRASLPGVLAVPAHLAPWASSSTSVQHHPDGCPLAIQ